ncbi:MAG: response regulator [Chitinophagaceae bacterium]|nr:response regulator [Chitinophagaceae bacterium]
MLKTSLHILLVDDNIRFLNRLTALLEELHYSVTTVSARSLDEAFTRIKEKKPAIVLLDIHMPGKGGMELLAYIKEQHPDTIVIMLTNETGGIIRERCRELGAAAFLDKTNEIMRLPVILEEIIAGLPEKSFRNTL